ncbi:MAG: hypothetical protein FWD84_03085 [Oscillospiraceae bacterium]|nr:hypothetical protein [Oscillospiraceae bacterium]
MSTFTFKNYTLDLTIAGALFQVNCVAELADKVAAHQMNLTGLAAQISEGTKTGGDAVELCKEITDDILGDDAFDSIFTEKEPTLTDCADVLQFVIGEITEFVRNEKPPEV